MTEGLAALLGSEKKQVEYYFFTAMEPFKIGCAASMLHAFATDSRLAADTPLGNYLAADT